MMFPSYFVPRIFTFLVVVLNPLLSVIAIGQEPKPTISVKGEAEVSLIADEIVIHASIESRAKTAADACKDNREKCRLLLEFLKSQRIDEKQIRTDLLSIDPIDPDPGSRKGKGTSKTQSKDDLFGDPATEGISLAPRPRIIGYTAFRNFAIVVKDLTKFEEIYQGIVENGINRVDNVEYRSSHENVNREKLRQQAVRVAKERAQAMARELGATLSAIKSIGNVSGRVSNRESRGVLSGMGGMGGGYGDPFSSREAPMIDGQITLQSSVDVVFYLGNTELKE